jgi:hypothetical protein
MSQTKAIMAPAELSQSRKHAIFFILIVKMVVNMQQVARRFKALKTELSKQREHVRNYLPDPKELLTQYSKIFSDISGVPHDEMRLFVKEYIKDHFKKNIKNLDIGQEKADQVLYNFSLQGSTVKGITVFADTQERIKKIDNRPKKFFQTELASRIEGLKEIMEFISKEMSNLVDCSVDELDQTQYVLIEAIINDL